VSQSETETGLVPDAECRRQLGGVGAMQWSRWAKTLPNFPEPIVVLGRKYRRHDAWAAFRDALLAAGDGSVPHGPRRGQAEASP
jgi:hypothetical protein